MSVLQEIAVPLLAVNDTSLTVVELSFANGQPVKKGDVVLVFETSKTTYDVPAEASGYIQYLCEQGNDYDVNTIVARIVSEVGETAKETVPEIPLTAAAAKKMPATAVVAEVLWEGETLFSAQALHLLIEAGLDKSVFAGKDMVSREDVEAFISPGKKQAPKPVAAKTTAAAPKNKPAVAIDKSKVVVEKLTSAKKREIEYLGDVQSTGLTSTINTAIETEGIFIHLNNSLKYLKNSLLPVIIYETARLLQKFPVLNAYYTPEGIACYNSVNVGFAIDIDKGLKVAKIEQAAEKSMSDIEASILQQSEKYLEDTLQLSDLTDITFTITDLSSEGVSFFRPLVNMQNSAILGISAIDEKLQRCILSITFDHRVTEGKPVAQFLQQLKQRVESYRAKHVGYPVNDITCFRCMKSLADDLGDTGFVKAISPEGREGYLCQSCLKGF